MPVKNTIKCIAATLMITGATATFSHTDSPHTPKIGPVIKEQKDWGIAGNAKSVTRTITIRMLDTMRFAPDKLDIKQGETIKFVIHNKGTMLHEMVIGTKKELDAHAALMVKFPGMEHDEPYMAHVAPGKAGHIIWTFNQPGNFDFACLIAGHYQAGMVGKITVLPR